MIEESSSVEGSSGHDELFSFAHDIAVSLSSYMQSLPDEFTIQWEQQVVQELEALQSALADKDEESIAACVELMISRMEMLELAYADFCEDDEEEDYLENALSEMSTVMVLKNNSEFGILFEDDGLTSKDMIYRSGGVYQEKRLMVVHTFALSISLLIGIGYVLGWLVEPHYFLFLAATSFASVWLSWNTISSKYLA